MNNNEAKRIGRKETIKNTTIVLAILIFIYLFGETRGDFSNGILFFMQAILNIHFFIILLLLFGSTYLFGSKAGVDIIIEKKNTIQTTLKYGFLISILLTSYIILLFILREDSINNNSKNIYIISSFLKTYIMLIIIWLWSTKRMKVATKKMEEIN